MPPLPKNGSWSSVLDYAPDHAAYALHIPYSLYLAAKYRGWFLPAIANPSILTGGLGGESKTDLYELLGPYAREFFAPIVSVRADEPTQAFREKLRAAGIEYPLIAKPDVGRNGRGVRLVHTDDELAQYLNSFPKEARMVLQKYIADEGEAGIFYVRKPSETHGRITSVTLKYFPRVAGDGRSTLRELIMREPRPESVLKLYLRRNRRFLERVIPEGETYRLASVGNYVRGAIFMNGEKYVTPEMTAAFDRISKDIKGFYFGRFDVRFNDIHDLAAGKNFTLLEFNGSGSEPTHVYTPGMSWREIYRAMLFHWRCAYEIGAEHRDRGVRPVSFLEVLRIVRDEHELISRYPDEE